ncbi:hypothetical protein ACFFUE_02100 [Bergeyella porcorum]|uniref:hypothetical protein n=1 Tax=Bergeyella porcorum TaxID=1735111 RepID=UPI0035EB5B7E
MKNFIQEFIKIGKLTQQQKDKMLEIIITDKAVGKAAISAEEVPSDGNSKYPSNKSSLPDFKDPFGKKSLSKFILAYNQDPLLKYTWHTVDGETIEYEDESLTIKDYIKKLCNSDVYSVREHQKLLKTRFDELKSAYSLNKQIQTLLNVYLTGEDFYGKPKKWSSNEVEINWRSENLLKWSDENKDCIPHANGNLKNSQKNNVYKLPKPFNSKLNGKRIRDFSELVIHCKNLFHIRTDNSLKSILEYIIEQNKDWRDKINFEFVNFQENITLFTDVDKLCQFFKEFVRLIINELPEKIKNSKHQIELSFTEKDEYINFVIHHISIDCPYYGKSSSDTIRRLGNSYTSMINKINGMCELWLEADFPDEPSYRINLWTEQTSRHSKTEIKKVGGVKHILKFKQ